MDEQEIKKLKTLTQQEAYNYTYAAKLDRSVNEWQFSKHWIEYKRLSRRLHDYITLTGKPLTLSQLQFAFFPYWRVE